MRLADWVVRAVVFATFIALLISPEKWGPPLGLISLGIMGVWALLYPQGVLGWAKNAYRTIGVDDPAFDVDDPALWWVPRLIGALFVAFAVLLFVIFGFKR